jgi:phosphatidylglycerol:prolipoprotein diacylglycerol transferase
MIHYPDIDPVLFALGPLQVRWYGLMYLLGFAAAWWLAHRRAQERGGGLDSRQIDDLLFYAVLGVVLGGRIGYTLFYQSERLLHDPTYLLRIWEGGMSFHGGMLGVFLAVWLFARRTGKSFFVLTDFVAPLVPLGLGAGRIGNFINGELWGRASEMSWGVQVACARFPEKCAGLAPDALWSAPLHPSQLYEALLEGLVLFIVLWLFSARPRPLMAVSGLFLLGYGSLRFLVEFVREPDWHIGFLAFDWLTMGQLLSLPMLAGGLLLMVLAYRRQQGAK